MDSGCSVRDILKMIEIEFPKLVNDEGNLVLNVHEVQ